MNRKFEDKLVQLAFGDMSAEEAARVEAEVKNDPIAAQTLASYRDMRSGFSLMSEVPEDQLSKERLREAILKQGLKPKPVPRFAFWSYAWMPVAACAFTFGILVVKNHRASGEPTVYVGSAATNKILGGPGITKVSPTILAKVNEPSSTTIPHQLTPEDVKLFAEETIVGTDGEPPMNRRGHRGGYATAGSRGEGPRGHREATPPQPLQMVNIVLAGGVTVPVAVAEKSSPINAFSNRDSGGPVVPLKKNAKKATGEEPIILIQDQQDTETGAQMATEVGSASNVIVGG